MACIISRSPLPKPRFLPSHFCPVLRHGEAGCHSTQSGTEGLSGLHGTPYLATTRKLIHRQTSSSPQPTSQPAAVPPVEPSLDSLTPLLESLMIGASETAGNLPTTPKVNEKPKAKSGLKHPKKPKPGSKLKEPVDPSRCVRCHHAWGPDDVPCAVPCCKARICIPCLEEALGEVIQTDLWHQLGLPGWVGCLASSCQGRLTAEDVNAIVVMVETLQAPCKLLLQAAQQARNSLENIRPRPNRQECELAQRLHKALTSHGLMWKLGEADSATASAALFPVRSGFLTQSVPILAGLLKTTTKTCTSCSAAFQAVDDSNGPGWTYVSNSFPGDWTWMVLRRPSKTVLPECAGKHSLDICPACLPKLVFSGLKFLDAVSGTGNYRFACPLCKHVLSPVQVERLARLIDPRRAPATLSGISVTANFSLGTAAKPAPLPKTVTSLLGQSNSPKFLGGGLSKAPEPESSPHKEALMNAIVSKKPNVKWDDVAGLVPAKQELQRAIVFPARFPNLYDNKRRASGAILLYGPPGTGKSYLAKAVATEVDHTFFSISSGDVVSKWMGESEKYASQ